jgi:uncharacterized protein
MLDPRVHPGALEDRDLETLRFFGVETLVLVSDATVHPAQPKALLAAFDHLLGVEVPRFERAGFVTRVALGVHPAVVPHRGLTHVLETLPTYLKGGKVVALGLLGLSRGGEAEEEALLAQLELASSLSLPAMITTPHRHREAITRRLLTVLQAAPLAPDRILIDGAVGRTARIIRELGYWTGLTLHPEHLSPERAVALVRTLGPGRLVLDTATGDGARDLLALPRAVRLLERSGLTRGVVARVSHRNAAALLGLGRA